MEELDERGKNLAAFASEAEVVLDTGAGTISLATETILKVGHAIRQLHDRWAEANGEANKARSDLRPTQMKLAQVEGQLEQRTREVGELAKANADVGMFNLVLQQELQELRPSGSDISGNAAMASALEALKPLQQKLTEAAEMFGAIGAACDQAGVPPAAKGATVFDRVRVMAGMLARERKRAEALARDEAYADGTSPLEGGPTAKDPLSGPVLAFVKEQAEPFTTTSVMEATGGDDARRVEAILSAAGYTRIRKRPAYSNTSVPMWVPMLDETHRLKLARADAADARAAAAVLERDRADHTLRLEQVSFGTLEPERLKAEKVDALQKAIIAYDEAREKADSKPVCTRCGKPDPKGDYFGGLCGACDTAVDIALVFKISGEAVELSVPRETPLKEAIALALAARSNKDTPAIAYDMATSDSVMLDRDAKVGDLGLKDGARIELAEEPF